MIGCIDARIRREQVEGISDRWKCNMLPWSRTLDVILEALMEAQRVKPAAWAARRVLLRRGLAGKPVDRFITGVVTGFARGRRVAEELCKRLYGNLCRDERLGILLLLHVYLQAVDTRMRSEARNALLELLEARLRREGVKPRRADATRGTGLPVSEWIFEELVHAWGRRVAEELLEYMSGGRRIHWFRVNPLRVSNPERVYEKVLRDIDGRGGPSRVVPLGFYVEGPIPRSIARMLDRGVIVAQDESAAAAALMLEPRPGEVIVDMCAAPGGKTSMLAALTGNRARIISVEVSASRASSMKRRLRKLGVDAEILVADARKAPDILGEDFADAVLLDPPCTSTGVLDKSPDARWLDRGALDRLVALQRELLSAAVRLVKPGGRVLYVTCSLLPAENEHVVYDVLEAHPSVYEESLQGFYDPSPYMPAARRAWPHRHRTGGMFYALLVKK